MAPGSRVQGIWHIQRSKAQNRYGYWWPRYSFILRPLIKLTLWSCYRQRCASYGSNCWYLCGWKYAQSWSIHACWHQWTFGDPEEHSLHIQCLQHRIGLCARHVWSVVSSLCHHWWRTPLVLGICWIHGAHGKWSSRWSKGRVLSNQAPFFLYIKEV